MRSGDVEEEQLLDYQAIMPEYICYRWKGGGITLDQYLHCWLSWKFTKHKAQEPERAAGTFTNDAHSVA